MIIGIGCATHEPIRSGKMCTTVQWTKDAKSLSLFRERVGVIGAILEWPAPRYFDMAINLPNNGIGNVKIIKLVYWGSGAVNEGCENKDAMQYQVCNITSQELEDSEAAIMFYSSSDAKQANEEIIEVREYFVKKVLGCTE